MKAILTVSAATAGTVSAIRLAAPISAWRRLIMVPLRWRDCPGRPARVPGQGLFALRQRQADSPGAAAAVLPGGRRSEAEMRVFTSPAELEAAVGAELGVSGWFKVGQE